MAVPICFISDPFIPKKDPTYLIGDQRMGTFFRFTFWLGDALTVNPSAVAGIGHSFCGKSCLLRIVFDSVCCFSKFTCIFLEFLLQCNQYLLHR